MVTGFGMTGRAGRWGALEHLVGVALCTFHSLVSAGQGKCGEGMVKSGIFPALGGVAGGAVFTELAIVFVVLAVAANTILRSALVLPVCMAVLASYRDVGAGELEGR